MQVLSKMEKISESYIGSAVTMYEGAVELSENNNSRGAKGDF